LELRCGDCGALFYLCQSCYRGQRFCDDGCRRPASQGQRRAANRRHRRSPEGCLDARDRARRQRDRDRARRTSVTDPRFPPPSPSATFTSCGAGSARGALRGPGGFCRWWRGGPSTRCPNWSACSAATRSSDARRPPTWTPRPPPTRIDLRSRPGEIGERLAAYVGPSRRWRPPMRAAKGVGGKVHARCARRQGIGRRDSRGDGCPAIHQSRSIRKADRWSTYRSRSPPG